MAAEIDLGLIKRPRRHVLFLTHAHAFLHRAAQLEEPLAQLIGGQLVDGPDAPIAQVVDIVDVSFAGPQTHHVADGVEVVQGVQDHFLLRNVLFELPVDAEAADLAQPVAVGVLELFPEQVLGLLQLRRIARAQPLIDLEQSRLVRLGLVILLEGIEDQPILDFPQNADVRDLRGQQLVEQLRGEWSRRYRDTLLLFPDR